MAVRPYGVLVLITSLAALGYLATGLLSPAPIVAGIAACGAAGAVVVGLMLLFRRS